MLSQTCEYALRAVACLARQPGEFVTASSLADATNVPPDYLSKVLQQLASAKVVQGRRGVGGGYRLARDPRDINLHDIIDAMGVISRIRACPTGEKRDGLCPLHETMDRAIRAAEQVFHDTTLADLISRDATSSMCVKHCDGAATATTSSPVARASSNGHAPSAGTVSTSRLSSSSNLREERFTRAAVAARPADEEFDEAHAPASASQGPVYTASGRLRAKPRTARAPGAPGTNGANGHSRASH